MVLGPHKKPRENVVELFCEGKGEVGGYSPQDIRDLVGELERTDILPEVGELSVRSSHAIFYSSSGRTFFCLGLWGGKKFHWLVWDPGNGEHIEVDEAFAAEVLEDAYRRCREQTIKRQELYCGFLAKLKRPEDRPLLEDLLADDNFYSVVIGGGPYKKPWTERFFKRLDFNIDGTFGLDFIYADSHARGSADRALAQWDGRKLPYISQRDCYYHFLGAVRVDVVVPANPRHRGGIWVYLVPESVAADKWDTKRPAHYLHTEFKGLDSRLQLGRTISCVFRSVTPGNYWVKAVWDAKKPFYQEKDTFYSGQKGDYESVDREVLEVKASRTTDVGKIECKEKVKGQ